MLQQFESVLGPLFSRSILMRKQLHAYQISTAFLFGSNLNNSILMFLARYFGNHPAQWIQLLNKTENAH